MAICQVPDLMENEQADYDNYQFQSEKLSPEKRFGIVRQASFRLNRVHTEDSPRHQDLWECGRFHVVAEQRRTIV